MAAVSEDSERRAGMEALHTELGHLQGRMDGLERTVTETRDDVHALRTQLVEAVKDALRQPTNAAQANTRQLWVAVAVLLSIISLIVAPIYTQQARNTNKIDHHEDGHPEWVTKLMAEKFAHVLDRISAVDKQHADEHLEQEGDIAELRAADGLFEARNDKQDSRLTHLEALADERTARFETRLDAIGKLLDAKAQDRWTGGEERVFQQGHAQQHAMEREEVQILRRELERQRQ